MLDGVARRENLEGIGQRVRRRADGDFAFLHRLKQRGLCLRRRAVDLVGQNEVREDGALHETKASPRRARARFRIDVLQDVGARDVGGQEVGRELDAAEREVERLRERRNEQRFGEPRHPHEQRMAARRERDQHGLHHILLTHDGPGDCASEPLGGVRGLFEQGHVGRGAGKIGGSGHGRCMVLAFLPPQGRK